MRKISTICKHLDAEYAHIRAAEKNPAVHVINIDKRVRLERELVETVMVVNGF
jgi:hypothetical protein